MARHIRVLLFIPHLGGGGAERVMAQLAQGLSATKYELHLGIVTQQNADGHGLPDSVTVHALGVRRVRAGAMGILRLVWRLRPDVILSGMAHLNFLVMLLRPFLPQRTRVILRQNGTVSAALAAGGVPKYTRLFYRLLYPYADCIICQSRAMADDLIAVARVAPNRIAVLPNPIDFESIRAATPAPGCWTGPGPHLLAVGRLAPEKGFDLLLSAFQAVRRRYPQAELTIAGAGPERETIENQARRLDLQSAVRFPGHVERPCELFSGATLFVLSSRHEGMPNALLEAAAAGLPLVATPASGGITRLLGNSPGAWLADTVTAEALATAILAALEDIEPGQRFAFPFLTAADPA